MAVILHEREQSCDDLSYCRGYSFPSPPASAYPSPPCSRETSPRSTISSFTQVWEQDEINPRIQSYYYKPLGEGEVRLLVVCPSECFKAPIRCRLFTVHLSEAYRRHRHGNATGFAALSYHSDSPTTLSTFGTSTIWLNGVRVGVKPNLLSALKHLRHSRDERTLWVDALCIDESDPAERAEHAYLQRHIYSLADTVYMWLGEAGADSDLAIKLLGMFGDVLPVTWGTAKDIDLAFWRATQTTTLRQHWDALGRLLRREYWSRVWIAQEVCLARNAVLCCGQEFVPWRTAGRFMCKYANSRRLEGSPCRIPSSVKQLCKLARREVLGEDHSMLELLLMARERRCQNPHDKVYGNLGLLGSRSPYLTVSYNEPLVMAYASTVQHALFQDDDLSILTACKRPHKEEECISPSSESWWPSWVPDWSCPSGVGAISDSYLLYSFPGSQMYRAAGDTQPSVSFSTNNLLLSVQGVCFDQVRWVSPRGPVVDFSTITRDYVDVKSNLPEVHNYGNIEELRRAFRRMWCLGQDTDGNDFWPSRFDVNQWFLRLIGNDSRVKIHPFLTFMQQVGTESSDLNALARPYMQYPGRCFVTEKGYIGRGPMCMREGDQIGIFLGGKVPFLLRQHGWSSQYRLQGECCKSCCYCCFYRIVLTNDRCGRADERRGHG